MKRLALKLFLGWGIAMVLAGCGTSVRLDKPAVDDRSTVSAAAAAAGVSPGANTSADAVSAGNAVSSGSVASVSLPGVASGAGNAAGAQSGAVDAQSRVLYFDYDSYSILPAYQPVVEYNARKLLANPARKVTLEGHTDDRGGREYNLALGQKRAEAVRRALILLGVSDAQLEAVSFGKEKPAVVGTSDEAMQKNRRVEISDQ
jgi:peptidoglycan-associated lipoprotein